MNQLFFSCLAFLEHEIRSLYDEIVEKADDPRVKLLLVNILEETRKHERVLEQISGIYGQTYPPQMAECEEVMGRAFRDATESTQSLGASFRKDMPLLKILENLIDHEKTVGEEYLTFLHSRVALLDAKETAIRKILEYIAADEERHQETLRLAISTLKGEKGKP